MAAGQPWPVCDYCDGIPLGLYLQFDIEERFGIGLAPGSHFLLFHCTRCIAVPEVPPNLRLPRSWLKVGHESSYRIIVNPPTAREVAHPPDPVIRERHLSFTSSVEKVSEGPDSPVGKRKLKIGGIPHWIQSASYPTCACGAPMTFVLQVPWNDRPPWTTLDGSGVAFACGLDALIFACSKQSHPYATIMIVQR